MCFMRGKVPFAVFIFMISAVVTSGFELETPSGWTPEIRSVEVNTSDGDQEVEITYYRNNIGMEFVWISPGKYWRGSRMTPKEVAQKFGGLDYWFEREHPRHKVAVMDIDLTQHFDPHAVERETITLRFTGDITDEIFASLFDQEGRCIKRTRGAIFAVASDPGRERIMRISIDEEGRQGRTKVKELG